MLLKEKSNWEEASLCKSRMPQKIFKKQPQLESTISIM